MMSLNYFMILIQCHNYTGYIIKKHETLPNNPPIHIYIKRINSKFKFTFKINVGFKLVLQTSEAIKLIGSTKTFIDKTKNGENVPSPEVVEIALVQCNLVNNK